VRHCTGSDGKPAVDFLGTGGQVVCPPSLHPSGERREWEGGSRGEPAVVQFPALLESFTALLRAIGGQLPTAARGRKPRKPDSTEETTVCCDATGQLESAYALGDPQAVASAEKQARRYLQSIELPRSGHGGDGKTFRILGVLLYGFALPRASVVRLFNEETNATLAALGDPWDDAAIARKLDILILRGPDEDRFGAVGSKRRAENAPATNGTTPGAVNRSTRGKLVVKSAADIKPEILEWIVPEFIPAGMLSMIAGPGGKGKSTITAALGAALSRGMPAFGLTYAEPRSGKSLFIGSEDALGSVVVPRLLAMNADRSKIDFVEHVLTDDGALDFGFEHLPELREKIESERYKLVVIDPVSAFVHAAGKDEHKDGEVRSILQPLAKIASETGVAILLVKHNNKNVKASAVDKVGGSVAFTTTVRVLFSLGTDPNDKTASVMAVAKSNIIPEPDRGFRFRLQSVDPAEAEGLLREFHGFDASKIAKLARQMSRPEWLGECRIPADILNGPRKSEKAKASKLDEAATFIVSFLGEHAWPAAELDAQAHEHGIAPYTLKQAKEMLAKLPTDNPRHLCRTQRYVPSRGWWAWLGDPSQPKNDRQLKPAA
jgi:archaellum biogenesis ATPase FlaH